MFSSKMDVWWSEITGPASFVREIVQVLSQGANILLQVPEDLPWRRVLRAVVAEKLRLEERNLMTTEVDCQEELSRESDVGTFLLSKFAGEEDVRMGYRSSSGYTLQHYLIEHQVLRNRIIWVKGMQSEDLIAWVEFVKKFKGRTWEDGIFVLEAYLPVNGQQVGNHLECLAYNDFITYYDALLFNTLALPDGISSMHWKQYIAALAAKLCGCDVELSAEFIQEDFEGNEPLEILKLVSESDYFNNRKAAKGLDQAHPFQLIANRQTAKLINRLWEAQLQILFPLIEFERIGLIGAHFRQIEDTLATTPLQKPNTSSGELLTNPYDLEIGHLKHLSSAHKLDGSMHYCLYLPSEPDRYRLQLLTKMRNQLAHLEPCTVDQVRPFLELHPYDWK